MLKPVWRQNKTLDPVVERAHIDRAFDVVVGWQTPLASSQTISNYPVEYYARVIDVQIDGKSISYQNYQGYVTVVAQNYPRTIIVILDIRVDIALLGGNLPIGLAIINNRLVGQVNNINQNETVAFTLRATYNGESRDRNFQISLVSVPLVASISTTNLPSQITDNSVCARPYRTLGNTARGFEFAIAIDINDPDRTYPQIAIGPVTDLVPASGRFNGTLPPGLALDSQHSRISGRVSGLAALGRYFFEISLNGTAYPVEIVVGSSAVTSSRVSYIDWITPSGSLGVIEEEELCSFSVTAKARIAAQPVKKYQLIADFGPLPPGLLLNAVTGDIEGRAIPITITTDYHFTIRASNDTDFVERDFSITVEAIFTTDTVCEIILPIEGHDRSDFNVYQNFIPSTSLFRPNDVGFGIASPPYVHLLSGLPRDANFQPFSFEDDPIIRPTSHHSYQWINGQNDYVCDVIVRHVIDGWATKNDDENVNSHVSGILLPALTTMRETLSSQFGVYQPSGAASTKAVAGPLPRWMRNQKWFPAIVIGFVKPGLGVALAESLNNNRAVPQNREYKLDEAIGVRSVVSPLSLDAGNNQVIIVPFSVPANTNTQDLKRWAFMTEIWTENKWLVSGIDFTRSGNVLSFAAQPRDRNFIGVCIGSPNGTSIVNTPSSSTIITGPYTKGISAVYVNGLSIPLTSFMIDLNAGTITYNTSFPAGAEVYIVLSPTTYDNNTTTFDGTLVIKLVDRKIVDGQSLRK